MSPQEVLAGDLGDGCICGHPDLRHTLVADQRNRDDDVYPCKDCSCEDYHYGVYHPNSTAYEDECDECGHTRFHHRNKGGIHGCDGKSLGCNCTGFKDKVPQALLCECGHWEGLHTNGVGQFCTKSGCRCTGFIADGNLPNTPQTSTNDKEEPGVSTIIMLCVCGHTSGVHTARGCAVCRCPVDAESVVRQGRPEYRTTPVVVPVSLRADVSESLFLVRSAANLINASRTIERTLERVLKVGNSLKMYDRQGKEIDVFDWTDKVDDDSYRVVGLTTVGSLSIATFWVGISYGNKDLGIKGIFESSVADSWDANYSKFFKWDTETEAIEGHEKLVTMAEMKVKMKRVEVKPE